MSAEGLIYSTLCDHLISYGSSLPIAWPNVNFDPPESGYLSVNYLPNITERPYLGSNKVDWHFGIFQVDVFYPEGGGSSKAIDVCNEIAKHFQAGERLDIAVIGGTRQLDIYEPPSVLPPINVPPFEMVSVSIQYRAALMVTDEAFVDPGVPPVYSMGLIYNHPLNSMYLAFGAKP